MKKSLRLAAACFAAVICITCLVACERAENTENETILSPYDETVPASFSEESGIGRPEAASKYNPRQIEQQEKTGRTICVDPGHGFVDGGCGEGCYSDGTVEKDITLAIANKLTERLKLLGYTVIQTHDGENIPSADTNCNNIFSATERAAYVNTLDIDYLVSIHVNALDSDADVNGMHIYYQQSGAKVNTWGKDVCESIQKSLIRDLDPETKPIIKDGTDPNTSFSLTRDVRAASSLIEVGFVTNEEDAANMVDPGWQDVVADAIADGIDTFFKSLT